MKGFKPFSFQNILGLIQIGLLNNIWKTCKKQQGQIPFHLIANSMIKHLNYYTVLQTPLFWLWRQMMMVRKQEEQSLTITLPPLQPISGEDIGTKCNAKVIFPSLTIAFPGPCCFRCIAPPCSLASHAWHYSAQPMWGEEPQECFPETALAFGQAAASRSLSKFSTNCQHIKVGIYNSKMYFLIVFCSKLYFLKPHS